MRRTVILLVTFFLSLITVTAQAEDVDIQACREARDRCLTDWSTCLAARHPGQVFIGYGNDDVCDDQYDLCLDYEMPWYCGEWAF